MTTSPTTPTTPTVRSATPPPGRATRPATWWEAMPWDIRLSLRVVAFTFLVSLLIGVVMGTWLLWTLLEAG